MPRAPHRSLPYRPALDGVRAVAVTAVVVYHLDNDWLPGGWLGVDLFFVLSGFLITSLLLAEHGRWGSIDLLGFWRARARRLLPGLIAMLLAVLSCSAILAVPSRRGAIGADVASALLYVANWRFLFSDDQYFATISMPSPVLHTWSLAIEEQYYLLFPLFLTAVCWMTRRRTRIAALLAVLAGLSALWMAHLYVPNVDPSRVYYGTDTRAFELLIGAAAGALLGSHDFFGHTPRRLDRRVAALAWPATASLVLAFFTVSATSGWLFRGGMVALALCAVVLVVASASSTPSAFQRLLSREPLRRVGLLSYSLYLWHWPVIVFLGPDRVAAPHLLLVLMQAALSVLLAWLSLTLLERPVRTGGLRALIPRRPAVGRLVGAIAFPAVLAGTLALPSMPASQASTGGPNINLAQPDYVPLPTRHTVTLLGNSIPASMVQAFPAGQFPGIDVADATSFGCDPLNGRDLMQTAPSATCLRFQRDWPTLLTATGRPDLVLLYAPQTLVSDRQVDGRRLRFGTASFVRWLDSELSSIRDRSLRAGATHFAVMNLACHEQVDFGQNPEAELVNDDARVQRLNSLLADWGHRTGVPIIDQYAALCTGGYHERINGTPLYVDTLHFSSESGAIMWHWMAPQLQRILRRP